LTFFEFIAIIRYKPKKEVIKVGNLKPEILEKLEIELFELNSQFDHEKFLELYSEIVGLSQMGFLSEIENYLRRLLAEQKLGIVNGFLFLFYFNFGTHEKSRFYLGEIKKIFPEDEFWDNLANSELWEEFSKSRECDA